MIMSLQSGMHLVTENSCEGLKISVNQWNEKCTFSWFWLMITVMNLSEGLILFIKIKFYLPCHEKQNDISGNTWTLVKKTNDKAHCKSKRKLARALQEKMRDKGCNNNHIENICSELK